MAQIRHGRQSAHDVTLESKLLLGHLRYIEFHVFGVNLLGIQWCLCDFLASIQDYYRIVLCYNILKLYIFNYYTIMPGCAMATWKNNNRNTERKKD